MAFPNQTPTLLAGIPPVLPAQDRALSWACSLCVHTLALAVAAVGLREFPQAPAPVYRMEILLSEAQQETTQTMPKDQQGRPDPGTHQETATFADNSSPIAPSPSPSIKSEPSKEVKQPASQRVAAATPAQPAPELSSAVDDPLPIENPTPIENQSEPPAPVTEPDPPASQSPAETIEQAETATATNSHPEPIARNIDDPAKSPTQQENAAVAQTGPTPPTSINDSQTDASGSPTASSEETVAFNHPAITQSVSGRSQYEWLMELLRRRIMSLQSYPHQARMQGWEGVVVVKTTIDKDGGLIDAVVTKSSGYGALDEDAVRLMHRVCPVHLTQDLGKSKIAVMIPIRYRLDGFEQ